MSDIKNIKEFYNLDKNDWIEYAITTGFDKRIIEYIKHKPSQLIRIPNDNDVICFPCPKNWQIVDTILKTYTDYAIIIPLIKGTIGSKATEKFIKYIKKI